MDQPSPNEIAQRYDLADTEQEISELIGLLRHDREYGRTVLEALASSKDCEIRLWVPEVAAEILGRDSVPILRKLSRDRDSDVRIESLNALVAIDPEEARRMGKTLRKRVKSDDFYEAAAALWALGGPSETLKP